MSTRISDDAHATEKLAGSITADELALRMNGLDEWALLDVREGGVFARGHILLATSIPLSRLELRITALVPRRGTPIVICDDGEGLAERAASKLTNMGYSDVAILAGGIEAWAKAGFKLVRGVYVPSKAFGEFVERHYDTPAINPEQLAALLSANPSELVIVDARPLEEFRRYSLPGGLNCPGAELVYRIPDFVSSPDTMVVVNCAGRTRSILGAQSLRLAGLENPVVALRNGTMGWRLAGFETASGSMESVPPPSHKGLAKSRDMAQAVARRFGVESISMDVLRRFQEEEYYRTLYVFDVRGPDAYRRGHMKDTSSAPGGQLVQATDAYIGVLNGRIVLVDGDGVQAPMTAAWLRQRGLPEVYVLNLDDVDNDLVSEDEASNLSVLQKGTLREIDPFDADRLLRQGEAILIDLATSDEFYDGHIPGAYFAIRSRFASSLPALPQRDLLILTSPDGTLATIAAPDARQAFDGEVAVIRGGTDGWRSAGLDLERGFERALDPPEDMWHTPSSPFGAGEKAMRDYLSWEVDLIDQVGGEPGLHLVIPDLAARRAIA